MSWPTEFLPSVEAFLSEDYLRKDLDGSFKSDWFFPLQRRRELERMLAIAKEYEPATVMEIGADKGSGVYAWCKMVPSVRNIIACEIRGTPYSTAMERAFPHIDFLWLPCPSRPVVGVQEWLGRRTIDVLFIDGCKLSFEQDFDAYLHLVTRPGVVFMHDVNDDTPTPAFERVRARGYRSETIIDVSEVNETMFRAERGEPPTSPHDGWLRHWRGRSCGVGVLRIDR